jgi:hypothetical protein
MEWGSRNSIRELSGNKQAFMPLVLLTARFIDIF